MWQTYRSEEFHHFWSSVCSLPQVQSTLQVNVDLNILPYDSCLTLCCLKRVLFDIIWRNKYSVFSQLFVDSEGDKIDNLKSGH